jgi:hypothetical protein
VYEPTPDFLLGDPANPFCVHVRFDEGYGSSAWKAWLCRAVWDGLEPFHDLVRVLAGSHRLTAAGHLWDSQLLTVKVGHHPFLQPGTVVERAGHWLDPDGGMAEPGCWVRQYVEPGTGVDRTHRAVLHGIAHVLHDPANFRLPVHDEGDPHSVAYPHLTQTLVEPHWPADRLAHAREVARDFALAKVRPRRLSEWRSCP